MSDVRGLVIPEADCMIVHTPNSSPGEFDEDRYLKCVKKGNIPTLPPYHHHVRRTKVVKPQKPKRDFTHLLSGGGRKKAIRNLLMRKAKEELEKEKERQAQERQNFIDQYAKDVDDIDEYSKEDLLELIEEMYDIYRVLEGDRWECERTVKNNALQIEDLKGRATEGRGKFMKPPLKKVVTQKESRAKALERAKKREQMLRAVQMNLKQTDKKKKALEETSKDEPDWREQLKKKDEEKATAKATKDEEEEEEEEEEDDE